MSVIKSLWQKAPVAMPLIALYHLAMFGYLVYDAITDPVGGLLLFQPFIMLLYTVAWLLVCSMKKWTAFIYTGITTANLIMRLLITDPMSKVYFIDTLFPMDIVFTFVVLLYYKKFD